MRNSTKIFFAVLFHVVCSSLMAQPLASANENGHRTERSVRYLPDGEDFVIVNGKNKFNRALYGGHSGFRLETGDVPEFALYLPRMGGNLTFAICTGKDTLWLNDADFIECRYKPGTRLYTISDTTLSGGVVRIAALTLYDTDGAVWKITSENTPANAKLIWRFGGAADKRFSREGDMGVDPPDSFNLKPEYCVGNEYAIRNNAFIVTFGQQSKTGKRVLHGVFPPSSTLTANNLPVLSGSAPLTGCQYVYIGMDDGFKYGNLEKKFHETEQVRKQRAAHVKISTPDPFLNTVGGALAVAADGIWDGQTWLHGAVGWRMPLAGWRAAYAGNFLGRHDRAKMHFNAYAASQVTHVAQTIPHPAQDETLNLARSVKQWGTPQYSNGYICRNPNRNDQMHHYDMNLNYIDELLWHFNWTGDLDYARQMWPVLTRHLAWEKTNYDPDNDGLYDAYACIWASDALYYNSGAVTHSTAYNYRANRMAAEIALKIGENPTPYRMEAEKIRSAVNQTLWMPDKGHWAEYKDFMGHKRLHESAALWTIYQAIDCEIGDPFQQYQATRYVDNEIPRIPVRANGLEGDGYFTVSTTNWLPYAWSINNVAFAEVMNMALAYFQAGRRKTGFNLLKSSVLDGMYLGGSPGNFGQISFYDAARGESYRDFGDPVGVASRAFVQGLFGITPDAMNRKLLIKPGFPDEWTHAELSIPDITFSVQRKTENTIREEYTVENRFSNVDIVELKIPAQTGEIVSASVNGKPAHWTIDEFSIEKPIVRLNFNARKGEKTSVKIEYAGETFSPHDAKTEKTAARSACIRITHPGYKIIDYFDPQNVLRNKRVRKSSRLEGTVIPEKGNRTLFVQVKKGKMKWWIPVEVEILPKNSDKKLAPFSNLHAATCEPINIDHTFNASVTDIFRNKYLTPRSPYTTLQIPTQGIGEWCHPLTTADIDDSGIRKLARDHFLPTSLGFSFRTPSVGKNISFTALWDNYPDSLSYPLHGKASNAYLLMAGSTNHMQCHIANGVVRVYYKDGTSESVQLVNPDNWCPIEQDYFIDGIAFRTRSPRPYRLHFKTGIVSDDLGKELNIGGVYGRAIDGGAGVLLDVSLNPSKELDYLTLETLSNDVVIGIMGITLQRP